MKKIENGSIIKVNIPNMGNSIKAIVLDKTEYDTFRDYTKGVILICYAHNLLFKVSCKYYFSIKLNEDGIAYKEGKYEDFKYEGNIIYDYELPNITSNINNIK